MNEQAIAKETEKAKPKEKKGVDPKEIMGFLKPRMGARFTAILGPDEIEQGVVGLKDMASGEQVTVKRDEVIACLSRRLGG